MLELSRVYIVASVAESVLPIFEPDPSDRTNTIETGHREVVTLAPLLSEKRSLYGVNGWNSRADRTRFARKGSNL